MEKEVFVKIIDAIVEFIHVSNGLNDVLKSDIDFGIKQIEEIVEALEIQFDDVENWIYWWLYEAGENKELYIKSSPAFFKHFQEVYEANSQEVTIKLPTAGDLYDWLDWKMANS